MTALVKIKIICFLIRVLCNVGMGCNIVLCLACYCDTWILKLRILLVCFRMKLISPFYLKLKILLKAYFSVTDQKCVHQRYIANKSTYYLSL